MDHVGAYEAKTHLGELLDRVEKGARIVITRHGVPVAVLQSPEPAPQLPVADVVAALKAFRAEHRASAKEIAGWIAEGRD